jgi:hypothetical protein
MGESNYPGWESGVLRVSSLGEEMFDKGCRTKKPLTLMIIDSWGAMAREKNEKAEVFH